MNELENRVDALHEDVRRILREFSSEPDMPPGSIPRIEGHLAQINGSCLRYAQELADHESRVAVQEDRWKWLRWAIGLALAAGGGGGIAAIVEALKSA